jgi:hypothetical protein
MTGGSRDLRDARAHRAGADDTDDLCGRITGGEQVVHANS